MTKINLKVFAHALLCIGGTAGLASPAFAQVEGGNAEGDRATVVCRQNISTLSIACGQTSGAAQGGTVVGSRSGADGRDSTAIGRDADATGVNSVSLGAFSDDGGQNNVVSVGDNTFQRRIINVAAGTLSTTSTDAVNGRQLFITIQGATAAQTTASEALAQNVVQDTRLSAVETVNATQNSRLTTLEALNTGSGTRLAALETLTGNFGGRISNLELESRQATGGIAAAMALGGAVIVPDANVSMSFNLATYRGEQGFSGSVIGKVSEKVYISGGVAGSTVKGSTGGRVGVTFGF